MSESTRTILVTGALGMLGTDLVECLKSDERNKVLETDIETLDITNLRLVRDTMLDKRPDVIIHCAGYNAVDMAEQQPLQCFDVNVGGTKNIAIFARELKAKMIFISTDYVFDGLKNEPYVATDKTNPLNTYGESKLEGEEIVAMLVENHQIVRTSWLCGIHGPNFIENILDLASRQKTIAVVNDQMGSPTFTFDLAKIISQLIDVDETGIIHATNQGFCSWYEFASLIIEELGLDDIRTKPITSRQFRSMAKRPNYSVLGHERLKSLGLDILPRWEDGLKRYLELRGLAK